MRGFLIKHGFMRTVDRLTKLAYRLSGGRVGRRQGKFEMLLLTTTGRKTGRARIHTLLYVRDGARYVVCASNFGAPVHPAWYLNLCANPHALVQDGPRRLAVVAYDAAGEERERLWKRLAAVWPFFNSYQRGNPRQIPVVVLVPAEAAPAEEARASGVETGGGVAEEKAYPSACQQVGGTAPPAGAAEGARLDVYGWYSKREERPVPPAFPSRVAGVISLALASLTLVLLLTL